MNEQLSLLWQIISQNLVATILAVTGLFIFGAAWYAWHLRRPKKPPVAIELATPGLATKPKAPEGKYPALIIPKEGAWYFGKIPKPVGHVFILDTTMPETGDHYLVKELNGEYEAYEPQSADDQKTDTEAASVNNTSPSPSATGNINPL